MKEGRLTEGGIVWQGQEIVLPVRTVWPSDNPLSPLGPVGLCKEGTAQSSQFRHFTRYPESSLRSFHVQKEGYKPKLKFTSRKGPLFSDAFI